MLQTLSLGQMPIARRGSAPPPSVVPLVAPFAAVLEGLVASRQYQHLRSRGRGHDVAIHEAFGISTAREQSVGSICFAGKA